MSITSLRSTGLGERVAHVAPRLYELGDDVFESGHVQPRLFGGARLAVRLHLFGQVGDLPRLHVPVRIAEQFQEFFRRLVRFGVHGGIVENVVPVRDAQKARALRERLLAQLGHVQDLFPVREPPVLLAVGDDIFRHARVQPRDIAQQGDARRVRVHADAVHAVLEDARENRYTYSIHVVLVLPHTDGLGVDLDELRERVLQPARDGDGAALGDVKIGELLRGERACRVHGRAPPRRRRRRKLPCPSPRGSRGSARR